MGRATRSSECKPRGTQGKREQRGWVVDGRKEACGWGGRSVGFLPIRCFLHNQPTITHPLTRHHGQQNKATTTPLHRTHPSASKERGSLELWRSERAGKGQKKRGLVDQVAPFAAIDPTPHPHQSTSKPCRRTPSPTPGRSQAHRTAKLPQCLPCKKEQSLPSTLAFWSAKLAKSPPRLRRSHTYLAGAWRWS